MDEINEINATEDTNAVINGKLRQVFDGRIVRKDLTKKIKEGANVPSIIGWYTDATVYRTYQNAEFDSGEIQEFNVLAAKENCILLPSGERHRHIWNAPTAKKRTYGFGQSMIWYATEENAAAYIEKLTKQISEYSGENWIDKSAEDM